MNPERDSSAQNSETHATRDPSNNAHSRRSSNSTPGAAKDDNDKEEELNYYGHKKFHAFRRQSNGKNAPGIGGDAKSGSERTSVERGDGYRSENSEKEVDKESDDKIPRNEMSRR